MLDQRVVGLTAILIGWPAFDSGKVYWSRGCFGDPGGCTGGVSELRRGSYTSPLTSEGAAGPKTLLAHERDAGVTWVLQDPGGDPRSRAGAARRRAARSSRCSRATPRNECAGLSSARACGRSVVVAQKPSKLLGRVRFPSPACTYGEWRSLVAHPAGGRAVAGSNPVSPTEREPRESGALVIPEGVNQASGI